MIIHRIFSYLFFSTGLGYNLRVFKMEIGVVPVSRDIFAIMSRLSYFQWYFMYKVIQNLDPKQVSDLIKGTADRIYEENEKLSRVPSMSRSNLLQAQNALTLPLRGDKKGDISL